MTLRRLIDKRRLTVLGINSGTSADGLDLAAVRCDERGRARVLDGATKRFPQGLRDLILTVADAEAVPLETVVHLDNLLGRFIGDAASAYVKRLKTKNIAIDMVASHGQTVRHVPLREKLGRYLLGGSLQLGSLDRVAAATGRVTAGDFRQADIALGGEGAPITTGAMRVLFGDTREDRLIVNIGGIANYFFFPAGSGAAQARDCGPGNSLSDILSQLLYDEPFDRNGRHAAAGTVSQRLLSLLTAHPFFKGESISTGRELFGPPMAERIIGFGRRFKLAPEDLVATAAEMTTIAIAIGVWPMVGKHRSLDALYLMGGGRRNRHFVRRLAHHLPDLTVRPVEDLGFNGDLVEAAAYAVMGCACVRSTPLTPATTTTTRRKDRRRAIAGHIAQPPAGIK